MGREKPYYREVLADLSVRFDNKMVVRIGEVAENFQISQKSAKNRFTFDGGGYITLYTLARDLCKEF